MTRSMVLATVTGAAPVTRAGRGLVAQPLGAAALTLPVEFKD